MGLVASIGASSEARLGGLVARPDHMHGDFDLGLVRDDRQAPTRLFPTRAARETARRLTNLLSEAGLDAASFAPRYLCLSAAVAEALPGNAMSQIAARPDEENLFRLL